MRNALLRGGVLGGLAMFAWSSVSWMLLPWHATTFERFTDEETVTQAIADNAPARGVYLLPNPHKHPPGMSEEGRKAAEAEAMKRMMQGPFVFASVSPQGGGDMGAALLIQLATQILAAVLATWLLLKTGGLTYWGRAGFIAALGLIAAVTCHLPYWNWWHFSSAYTAVAVTDFVIGWVVAGLVIARTTP